MRIALVVLLMCAVPFTASAELPSLTFSAVPAGVPDFSQWTINRVSQHTVVVTSAEKGPIEEAAIRHGLCPGALPCTINLRISFSLLLRCVAQNDREMDCRERVAFKSREVVAVVGRYVMERSNARAEGFALEVAIDPDCLYFVRTTESTQWRELPADGTEAAARQVQEDLFTALTTLSKQAKQP